MSNIFSSILLWLKNELTIIEGKAKPVLTEIGDALPGILVSAFQALLTGIEAGTPYTVVLATAAKLALSQGVKASETAIQAALNKAENNLIEAGTPAPITVAATAAAVTATPLAEDHPAVVSATAVVDAAVADPAAAKTDGAAA